MKPDDVSGDEIGAPPLPRYTGSSKVAATYHPNDIPTPPPAAARRGGHLTALAAWALRQVERRHERRTRLYNATHHSSAGVTTKKAAR